VRALLLALPAVALTACLDDGRPRAPAPEGRAVTGSVELAGPGWLLVVSDGLWNYLSEAPQLDAFVQATGSSDPMVIADALVERANAGGGHDNITAVVARILPDRDER